MKSMQVECATWITFAVFVAYAASSPVNAQTRAFTNDNGTVIEAELISHKGGKVKLKRTDGKEFEVAPSIFSDEDVAYITKWMAKTPASLNYNFKISAAKKKIEGNSQNMGYKRVKNDLWSYVISVNNSSQDPVSNLTIKYRVFYSNSADGEYSASSDDRTPLKMVEGKVELKAELGFNRVMEFTTTPVQLDYVNYGYGSRYKDSLKGCMVRIVDQAGIVVFDWVSAEVAMKGKGWFNTNPVDRDAGNVDNPVIIR